MSDTRNSIIKKGVPQAHPFAKNYEKTTDNSEKVAGLFLKKGTADTQLKLTGATDIGIAVADTQPGRLGVDANGDYNDKYIKDGQPIDAWFFGEFMFEGTLAASQTILMGDFIKPVALGHAAKQTTGTTAVAIAMESRTTTGSIYEGFLMLWKGPFFTAP